MTNALRELRVVALTVGLLGAAAADRAVFHTPPSNVDAYIAAIRVAAASIQPSVGSWLAAESPVPPAAIALLHPNVIISRRYTNIETGRHVDFLLVQCADARDLVGHYPPRCYPAHGWTFAGAQRVDWEVGGLEVRGTRYDFTSGRRGMASEVHVADFMVLPDGTTCPDMAGIDAAASDGRKKYFGAAQVQIVSDSSLTPAEWDEAVHVLVAAYLPVIDRIRKGVPPSGEFKHE